MSTESTIQSIIDSAIAAAQEAQTTAQKFADDAYSASHLVSANVVAPGIGELSIPTLAEPDEDLAALFEAESNAKADEIKSMVESELADFLNTYFPCGWISNLSTICNWIDDAIANGGTGLTAAVEQAIWDRARQREGRLDERMSDAVAGVPAALGWSVPSGAVLSRQMRAAHDSVSRDSTLSRDIMIEQARLEQTNIHFAISSGIQLHSMVMQAAINFVNAKLRAEALGHQYGQVLYTAAQALYSQMVQYYQAQLSGEQLELRQDIADVQRSLDAYRLTLTTNTDRARNRADAAMAGARTMGDIAASARSTTNTMASIASETTTEE